MTNTPTPSVDEIWAILRQTALQQQATQQQVDSNAKAIAANSEAISETRQLAEANVRAIAQLRDENRASIEDLVNMLTTQAEQAERDRLALAAEVRSLVNALRDRFGSNGHAGE